MSFALVGCAMIKSALIAASLFALGCDGEDRPVDPDGHEHETRVQNSALPKVSLEALIGAVGGVPERDAPMILERWLRAARGGDRLLDAWPRANGQLDLEHPPVALSSIDASIGPGSKSRCGEVTVIFQGEARVAVRMKLPIPATTPACRGLFRASRVTGAEAGPLLRAAIAEARVPDDGTPRVIAAN